MKQEIIDKQIELSGHMKDEKIKAIHETEQELRSTIIEIAKRLERIAHLYAKCSPWPYTDEHDNVTIKFQEGNGKTGVKVELGNKAGITYVIREEDPYIDFFQAKDDYRPVKNVFYQYSIAVIVLQWLKLYGYDICSSIADFCVSHKTLTSGYDETYYIDDIKGE